MTTIYNYALVDTADNAVNAAQLDEEVRASAITTALDGVTVSGADIAIQFKAGLSGGDEALLDALVTAHSARAVLSGDALDLLQLARGTYSNARTLTLLGRVVAPGSAAALPVAFGAVWPRPLPSQAVQLRVAAGGSADDTAGGAGARALRLVGLDASGASVTEVLATAGASASAPTSAAFLRLLSATIDEVGSASYAQVGRLTVEAVSGSTGVWTVLNNDIQARGASEIAGYTVPAGHSALVTEMTVRAANYSRPIELFLSSRAGVLADAAPFAPTRTDASALLDKSDRYSQTFTPPLGLYAAHTDIVLTARSTRSYELSASLTIVLFAE